MAPSLEERTDYGFAMVAAMLFNINRGEDVAAKTAADFLPDYLAEPPASPVATPAQQQEAIFRQLRVFGAHSTTTDIDIESLDPFQELGESAFDSWDEQQDGGTDAEST